MPVIALTVSLSRSLSFSPPSVLSLPSAPHQMLEPVTLAGVVSCVLSLLCASLNLLRGVHAIESILQVRASRGGWNADIDGVGLWEVNRVS